MFFNLFSIFQLLLLLKVPLLSPEHHLILHHPYKEKPTLPVLETKHTLRRNLLLVNLEGRGNEDRLHIPWYELHATLIVT
jgi:hypothetical protein